MRHRLLASMVSSLMVISLITVGFSSWTIVHVDAVDSETGDFHSEDIIDISKYLDMTAPTPLKYNKDGFIGGDKRNSKIECNGYTLHTKKCVDAFKAKGIQIQLKLHYVDNIQSTMDIFQHITPSVIHNDVAYTNVTSTKSANDSILTTITVDGEELKNELFNFSLIYDFNLPAEYFNNSSSPLWTKSQPVFKISAVLIFE